MFIEGIPELNVDSGLEQEEIEKQISEFEKKQSPLIGLQASLDNWKKIQSAICALRSANVSALLELRKSNEALEDDELIYVFGILRDWDQLYIQNFLELCGDWVPQEFQEILKNEAKIELKWAKEWLTAATDQRITKYPTLPWRSFTRKIVGENYQFAVKFLELAAAPATPENLTAIHAHIKSFVESKKKVVCVFPKKWKQGATEH
ncbi:MAG: hypothetical protein EB078_02375 [Proteobacteria bacterium]|nr:hypothetical protein [Pseudomonadota bacterium]NDC23664.1 hypothetical protein [Pseudomonadota bacterium]NDD03728.1 hypothetical protein [Pseudomonadota bacterium]NDG26210.1 hypothetical protein [Pseudomonadota bacterium]